VLLCVFSEIALPECFFLGLINVLFNIFAFLIKMMEHLFNFVSLEDKEIVTKPLCLIGHLNLQDDSSNQCNSHDIHSVVSTFILLYFSFEQCNIC